MRRGLDIIAAAMICAAVASCGPSDNNQAKDNQGSQADASASPEAAAPSSQRPIADPADANRPADEAALLKQFADYQADINAPNDIARNDISKKREAVWAQHVAQLGHLQSWTGKIDEIHDTGWFSIKLNDGLTLTNSQAMAGDSTIDPSTGQEKPNPNFMPWLFDRLKHFSKGEPVKFTGDIDSEFAQICFTPYEYSCTIKITSIDPL